MSEGPTPAEALAEALAEVLGERRCTCCGHERMECDCVACDCFSTGDGQ